MEHSSSAPVLKDEDYNLPCHGVGDTGPPPRHLHGPFSKDTGKYSSRLAQIVRQAEKVPGPGKYVAHEDWTINKKPNWSKGSRDYKPLHKNPDPTHYERKDFFNEVSNGGKECLSHIARVLGGKVPKGKRRSMTEMAVRAHAHVPPPGAYSVASGMFSDRLAPHVTGTTSWAREMAVHVGRGAPEPYSLAPSHYTIDYKPTEERQAVYTVPKEKAANFLDKAVKEKLVDIRNKKEMPGPGTYWQKTDFDDRKLSRGTRMLQLRGLTRASASGYF